MSKRVILMFAAIVMLSGAVFAQTKSQSDAVETMSSGTINWTTSEVTATGIGVPPTMSLNPAQARAMTERAAFVVALRNLLETVKGVRVDSESVVENFMVKSDVIKTRVDGIVKGARVVKTRYLSDGSVEVQVSMLMKGAFMDALVPEDFGKPFVGQTPMKITPVPQWPSGQKPVPMPTQPTKPVVPAPLPGKPAEPSKPVIPAPVTPEKKPEPIKPPTPPAPIVPAPATGPTIDFKGGIATGVVVDGRGLGLRPALLPKILDAQGQEIYVGQVVTRTNAVEQGVAGYAKDVNAAANNFRVTDNPAVLKGLRASGAARTDVMVSQADAQMLRQLSNKGDFLQYCRVIIVY